VKRGIINISAKMVEVNVELVPQVAVSVTAGRKVNVLNVYRRDRRFKKGKDV
jgi:hypothetical protein